MGSVETAIQGEADVIQDIIGLMFFALLANIIDPATVDETYVYRKHSAPGGGGHGHGGH